MAIHIKSPSIIKAAGTKGKIIKEFIGKVNSNTSELSIAMMKSPEGWEEPGQRPDFNEYTLVLKGKLKVTTSEGDHIISEGETIIVEKGEWIRYSSPFKGGAEYLAVCVPAFSPTTVHRDE